ncbi:MAG: hypothetical protein EHM50_06570 [Lysobacterales bacterium]|nr:MAG: hypothetical protein EHM50_06570 [Xanthomonadales bacterium]
MQGGAPLLVLIDRNLATSAALAAEAVTAGHRVLDFASDVASLWMNELEPRLRAGPLAMIGHTSAATLFCVELLARDYGARALQRIGHPAATAPALAALLATPTSTAPLEPFEPVMARATTAVTWLVATSHGSRAPLAPATHFARRS